MKRVLLLTTLLFLLAAPAAQAGHVYSDWRHWSLVKRTNLTVSDCVASWWDGHLRGAVDSWSASSSRIELRIVPCEAPAWIRVHSNNYGSDGNGQGGVTGWATSTRGSGTHGVHYSTAHVYLNSYYPARRSTACHELGHVLGMQHRGTTASCMYHLTSQGSSYPDWHDREIVTWLHNHSP